ncbi:MAG TPA: HAD-IA family hydrolase, partial [Albitalea sp.]|nr:HAD-IA family hydrolase [Albitalea sp.]
EDGMFSSRVQLIKPEPAIFHEAARRFRIAPGESLFIDDAGHNVAAAQLLGWQTLHFQSPEDCEAELAARGLI